jgi:hypothetical protein
MKQKKGKDGKSDGSNKSASRRMMWPDEATLARLHALSEDPNFDGWARKRSRQNIKLIR